MIIGTGIDLIEVSRIERAVKKEAFLKRVFTDKEREGFKAAGHDILRIAGCFAAKEAVSKALGTGFGLVGLRDIEILHESSGKPTANLYGSALKRLKDINGGSVHISITHIKSYAAAIAVINLRLGDENTDLAELGAAMKTELEEEAHVLEREDVLRWLPKRARDTHKGSYGRALAIAGSDNYIGAAIMCSAAALRAGCGLLKTGCLKCVREPLAARLPEAMPVVLGEYGWSGFDKNALLNCVEWADAVAAGPGLGAGDGVEEVIRAVLLSGKPCVIDADGLNAVSRSKKLKGLLHMGCVVTPHPGEMARLCDLDVKDILADPLTVAKNFSSEFGCVVLLKGAYSYIAPPCGRPAKNETGNAGLAKGGSGDVLTGFILAFLCQGLDAFKAACAGSYMLGASADEALKLLGNRMLLATDTADAIAGLLFHGGGTALL